MIGSKFVSFARYLPERVVTNHDLAAMMDTSHEWIVQRTGIEERRWVDGDIGASELAEHAAREALDKAGIAPQDLDLILYATLSPDITFPGSGCLLQARLGCPGVPVMDIRNQCSGFIYATTTADMFIRSGMMKKVLVIGAELHSSGLDMTSRGRDVTVLFGDGAGAAVMIATDGESRLLDSRIHADGRYADILKIVAPQSRKQPRITPEMLEAGLQYPHMEGRTVFRHAVQRMPEVVGQLLSANGYTADDVAVLVPHQANLRINEMVIRRLGIPREKMVSNIHRYGNTTAASIPIAMSEAIDDGRVSEGDLVVFVAFGAGLTWGATLIRW